MSLVPDATPHVPQGPPSTWSAQLCSPTWTPRGRGRCGGRWTGPDWTSFLTAVASPAPTGESPSEHTRSDRTMAPARSEYVCVLRLIREQSGDRTEESVLVIQDFQAEDLKREFNCSVENEKGRDTRRAELHPEGVTSTTS